MYVLILKLDFEGDLHIDWLFSIPWGYYASMGNQAFKPYGKPPPFDFEEYKDSFELWNKKWEIFLNLPIIDTALDAGSHAV